MRWRRFSTSLVRTNNGRTAVPVVAGNPKGAAPARNPPARHFGLYCPLPGHGGRPQGSAQRCTMAVHVRRRLPEGHTGR